MSTLSVTSINTANGTTDLTLRTGNSTSAGIVLQSNGNALVLQSNSTTNAVTIAANSFVGIGTTAANQKFHVQGDGSTTGLMIGGAATIPFVIYSATGAADSLRFRSQTYAGGSATDRMIIDSNGNVAIGAATTAGGVLTVSGQANVTGNLVVGTNTFTLGTSSIGSTAGSNGYSRLTNNLLLQWFTVASIVNTAAQSFTFPIGFTTACFSLVGTYSSISGAGSLRTSITNATHFSANTGGTASNGSFNFIAIGI